MNEQKFFERRKELNAEEEDEKVIEEQVGSDGINIDRDFYMNEVLSITIEYIEKLAQEGDVAKRN